jgi:hypothetical protein
MRKLAGNLEEYIIGHGRQSGVVKIEESTEGKMTNVWYL